MRTIITNKGYFLVLFFLLISFGVYAQKDDSSSNRSKNEFFAFGPKLSLNITNECFKGDFKSGFLPGADLGLFFRLSPGRLYIQPEVNYHIRNTSFESDSLIIKYETHHLNIPILVGIKAIDFKNLKLRFFIGPEFNMRFKSNLGEHAYQLGAIAGLGIDIWRFTIDASYSFLGYLYPEYTKHRYNNVIKIGVGFKCF